MLSKPATGIFSYGISLVPFKRTHISFAPCFLTPFAISLATCNIKSVLFCRKYSVLFRRPFITLLNLPRPAVKRHAALQPAVALGQMFLPWLFCFSGDIYSIYVV